jgi:hypothetical protein
MAEKKATDGPKKATAPKKKPAAKSSITLWELKKQIDERAHQLYLDRIAAHRQGDELSDWLQAEGEIKKKHKL